MLITHGYQAGPFQVPPGFPLEDLESCTDPAYPILLSGGYYNSAADPALVIYIDAPVQVPGSPANWQVVVFNNATETRLLYTYLLCGGFQ